MENKSLVLYDLPTEIILNICENIYIIDDLICLYKTCKFFKKTIGNYKNQILCKLFKSRSFSNSYYSLFFSFVNDRYEYTKHIPYKRLQDLLEWQYNKQMYNTESTEVLRYFIDLEKLSQCFIDDCLDIFKNFMYLLYIPSYYIYNSTYLLNKFFNIGGLCNEKKGPIELVKMQKELNYYNVMNRRKPIYTLSTNDDREDNSIFDMLIKIYPDVIITHLLNFQHLVNHKKYIQLLHNFVINLFLEWLFENECEFVETIYHKLYIHFPYFMQRTVYRVLYNEFQVLYHVSSDEFVEEFYNIHRIFLPSSKITKLYNVLNLESYRIIQEQNKKDWKRNLGSLKSLLS